jgi:hypothetical protein
MDSVTQMQVLKDSAGIMEVDEMRAQNRVEDDQRRQRRLSAAAEFRQACEALAKRDAHPQAVNDNAAESAAKDALLEIWKGLG